jgi:glyceraldehyde-3-phosphate dehydrogenase (NADP+)
VCISTQRVIVERQVYPAFLDALAPLVSAIPTGDPFEPETKLAAMISEREATRVQSWVEEAVTSGARVVAGGERDGAVHEATVVADVDPAARLFREELFGPVVGVTAAADDGEVLRLANASEFGLSAGVFTNDLDRALRYARRVDSGVVFINTAPPWRADLMPYGGVKQSGIGTEGPRYAALEMTEVKTVVFQES